MDCCLISGLLVMAVGLVSLWGVLWGLAALFKLLWRMCRGSKCSI